MAENCTRCGEHVEHFDAFCSECVVDVDAIVKRASDVHDENESLKKRERGILDSNQRMRTRLTAERDAALAKAEEQTRAADLGWAEVDKLRAKIAELERRYCETCDEARVDQRVICEVHG